MLMKNKSAILLAAALLAGISPAAAQSAYAASAELGHAAAVEAANGANTSSAAAQIDELRLKLGSKLVKINGSSEAILRAPFSEKGTTMVPLGVFTSAFGAESRLGAENTIKLTMGTSKVTMTIDSPVLWTNAGKSKMSASPAMVGGVLMVPLRPIAQALGATLSSSNGEIIVQLPKALEGSAEKGSYGTGSSLARVGNSYYGWSIIDPGKALSQGSQDESLATFSDAQGTYYLQIHAAVNQPEQDSESLLDNLIEEAKANQETVLNEEVVTAGGESYARMITSDSTGILSEYRAYYANHKIYEVYLTVADAYSYQDFDQYAGLLDSFQTSFDPNNSAIKDLSTMSEDGQTLYSDTYGIALTAPVGWSAASNGTDFTGPEGESLHFNVSSNPAGATLDNWTDQMKQRLAKLYVPSALKIKGVSEVEMSGEKANVIQAEINVGDGWKPLNQVLLIEDGYRYLMEYQGATTSAAAGTSDNSDAASAVTGDEVFDALLQSVDIPFDDIEDYYGKLEDRTQESDLSKMNLKTSTTYGFTVQIPRYWTANVDQFNQTYVQYTFPGGSFKLAMGQTDDPELYLGDLASAYSAAASASQNVTLTTEKSTIAGVPATIFTIHDKVDGIPTTKRVVAFSHKGKFYQLTFSLNDANATDEQKAAMSKVEKSFTFME